MTVEKIEMNKRNSAPKVNNPLKSFSKLKLLSDASKRKSVITYSN